MQTINWDWADTYVSAFLAYDIDSNRVENYNKTNVTQQVLHVEEEQCHQKQNIQRKK